MALSPLQIALWATAGLALAGFGAARVLSSNTVPVAQVTELAPFRPSFSLADAQGGPVSNTDFEGKFLLVFFGFTNCPDICPTTLSEVADVMDGLKERADLVQPLFISVDPERDAGPGLADYTGAFHPAIVGLTGTPEATQAAADSFRIYFQKEDQADVPGSYGIAHASALYLVGPDGNWIRQFDYGTPASEILDDLTPRLQDAS